MQIKSIDPKKTALLIIDIQNDFCHEKGKLGKLGADLSLIQKTVPQIESLTKEMAKKGVLLIYTKQMESKNLSPQNLRNQFKDLKIKSVCTPHSWGAEIYKLHPQKDAIVLEKKSYDCFSNPKLGEILKQNNRDTLIITGVNTDVCVDSTMRRAFTEGYNLIIAKDCIATNNPNAQKVFLDIFEKFFGSLLSASEIVLLVEDKDSKKNIPKIIGQVGFDFDWIEEKVWRLKYPVEEIDIKELEWHFKIPFWNRRDGLYDLKPFNVIKNPEKYKEEYERTMKADLSHPIDIMKNKGRWLILDGLHRLVKCKILGYKKVKVRKIPHFEIPNIS